MALTRVTFTIDDSTWPKVKLSGERTSSTGQRIAFDEKAQYDIAYSQFENAIHNQLRPAVDEIVRRRKQNN